MRYLLILMMAWLPLLCSAVDFDDATRSVPLGRAMQVFEDAGGGATIEEVSGNGPLAKRFRPQTADTLNAGYSTSVFWLKVDLHYVPADAASPRRSWLLELAYPPMDHIELYEAGPDAVFHLTQKTGDALPYSTRQIKQNNYVFDLPFQAGEYKTV